MVAVGLYLVPFAGIAALWLQQTRIPFLGTLLAWLAWFWHWATGSVFPLFRPTGLLGESLGRARA